MGTMTPLPRLTPTSWPVAASHLATPKIRPAGGSGGSNGEVATTDRRVQRRSSLAVCRDHDAPLADDVRSHVGGDVTSWLVERSELVLLCNGHRLCLLALLGGLGARDALALLGREHRSVIRVISRCVVDVLTATVADLIDRHRVGSQRVDELFGLAALIAQRAS